MNMVCTIEKVEFEKEKISLTWSWLLHFPHDMSHSRFVSEKSSEMRLLRWIIFRERLHCNNNTTLKMFKLSTVYGFISLLFEIAIKLFEPRSATRKYPLFLRKCKEFNHSGWERKVSEKLRTQRGWLWHTWLARHFRRDYDLEHYSEQPSLDKDRDVIDLIN